MSQQSQFLILFSYVLVAFIMSVLLGTISYFLNKSVKNNNSKLLNYETGCLPSSAVFEDINIQFYIIGIIFLILDIEIVLIFPWVLKISVLGLQNFYKILFLFIILGVGFAYEWCNNSLKWNF